MSKADDIAEEYPDVEMLIVDGYDDCIVGVAERCGQQPLLVYDEDLMIQVLQEDMSYEDAVDFFNFNIAGAWMGDGTPLFLKFK